MTKAIEAASGVLKRGTLISQADCDRLASAIITAFLDAAAGDGLVCLMVQHRAVIGEAKGLPVFSGKAAILALKEAANAG